MNNKKIKFTSFLVMFFLLLIPAKITRAVELDNLTNYKLNVKLNDEEKTITASETIDFTNKYEDELSELVFHLYPDSYGQKETMPSIGFKRHEELTEKEVGDIDITSLLVNGESVKFTEDNQILKFTLQTPLKPGEKIKIDINFHLKIPCGDQRLSYLQNQYSLTNWYPILSIYDDETNTWDENPYYPIGESNYSDCSNYNVILEVPKDIIVVSTGLEKNSTVSQDTKKINIEAASVRDFVIMMNKDYKVISKEVDGIKVNSYYIAPEIHTKTVTNEKIDFSEDNKQVAKRMLKFGSDALQFFSETFGKYPYKEFDIVESYLSGGAMEYPQLIQMGKYYSHPGMKNEENLYWNDEAVVHETCHQWWFSLVGNNEFKEPILDESMTVFSTALYFEKRYGEYCKKGIVLDLRNRIYPIDVSINRSVDSFNNWGDYSDAIYRMGAIVFEDLRQKVKEETFLDILKEYFNEYKYKNASVKGLLDIIEKKCGKEIRDYIDNAISSDNYDPKHLMLTEKEEKIANKMYVIEHLENMNEDLGTTISSIFLKGIEDESIYFVKPVISEKEKEIFEEQLNFIAEPFHDLDVKCKIISADKVSDEIKTKNTMILIGNAKNNKLIKEFNDSLPIKIGAEEILLDNIKINSENTSGIYITNNPSNKEKLLLLIFGDPFSTDLSIYGQSSQWQYQIIVDNKTEINGSF